MRAEHLFIPGLNSDLVDGGWLPVLSEFVPRERARLVGSFARSVTILETTLVTGTPPLHHGVLFEGETSRHPRILDRVHTRSGAASAREIEQVLRDQLDTLGEDDLLIVCGGGQTRLPARVVEPDTAGLSEAGFRMHRDANFALCESQGAGRPIPTQMVDQWLRTPGIERVLAPSTESAGSWMAPADRGWILLPEPGWRFAPTGSDLTPPPTGDAVILAFGIRWEQKWPDAVHDWRVAPTLLAAAGQPAEAGFDRPLPGLPRPRG